MEWRYKIEPLPQVEESQDYHQRSIHYPSKIGCLDLHLESRVDKCRGG